jgi:hypothetical protein
MNFVLRVMRNLETSRRSTYSTSEHRTLYTTYLYQKDDRVLPGNLNSKKFIFPR